jgi:predicted metal-dependent hydrolase
VDIDRVKKLAGISDEDKKREEVAVTGVPHDNILDKLVSFIQQKQGKITPDDLKMFAMKSKQNEDKVMEAAFELLGALLKGVGKHKDSPDTDFDQAELEKGVQVEKEHTNNEYVAKIIAKDHLKEIPDYYARLTKMEKSAD